MQSHNTPYNTDALVQKALLYLSSDQPGSPQWDLVGSSNGIEVFKAKRPLSRDKEELRWPCFKTESVVDCSLSRLYDSLMDWDNIKQYSE